MGTRPDPLAYLDEALADLRAKSLYRPLRVLDGRQTPHAVMDGRPVISLSSNNYLGLATHPHLVEAALAAVRDLGVGSGAVRTIAGTMELHQELERRLAAFKHTEAVLTFQSGFTANSGVIPTVTGERDLIVSDELNHASIIDGVRLSKAARAVYPHKDVDGLESVLRDARAKGGPGGAYEHILVITDGVFSMDGDIAPLPGICDVCERYDAVVMIDDAHASGVLGRNGRGTVDHFGLHGRVDIQVGTLSKAVGVLGGYVAGTQALRDYLIQRSRPILFSTSHPPAVVAACLRRHRRPGGRAGAHRTALGQHALLQGRPDGPGLRHRHQRDADHAGHRGRLRARRPPQRTAAGAWRLRPGRRLPHGRHRPRPDPHHRLLRAHPRRPAGLPGRLRHRGPGAGAHRELMCAA